jgi:DNA-binding Lrp family transcriptional regulator
MALETADCDRSHNGVVEIDELDRQIVQCLGADGRASFSQIAAVLGVSDQTVARRYRRLRSAGLLRIVGLRMPLSGGGWTLRMRCVPGAAHGIAMALAARPDTRWVQLLSADTEVLCHLRAPVEERDALLARLPRGGRIVAVTAYSQLHVFAGGRYGIGFLDVMPPEKVASLWRPPVPHASLPASEVDDPLFRALDLDGRTSHAELAATTGWSESTVRRRMDQLLAAGHLDFDIELDLATFGFQSTAWLWLSVRPSALATAGEALGRFPQVSYAAATSGPFNLAACAVCRDDAELYEFLTDGIGSLPDVDRIETSPVIRTVKQTSPAPKVR